MRNIGFLIAAILGNPLTAFVSWMVLAFFGGMKIVGPNVTQVYPLLFIGSLSAIFFIRFLFWHTYYNSQSSQRELNKQQFFNSFLRKHDLQFLGLPISVCWFFEMEGNAAGIIFGPISLVLGLIFSIVLIRRIRKIK